MKKKIHPKYFEATITCSGCSKTYQVGATVPEITINICADCHPFYTGKQRFVDSERRIDKFRAKYAKFQKQQESSEAPAKAE